MVINTLKHNYYVIHKLMEDKEFETYLCYDLDKDSQRRYRVCRLKNKELAYKLIPVFFDLINKTAFTDYYDCFSKDGYLHLVFVHNDFPLLKEKLEKDSCSLQERLQIGKNLIEHILMLSMPDFILFDALSEDCVTVSSSLEVSFHYKLTSLPKYDMIGIHEVQKRLVMLFKHIFARELELEASVDIENYIAELERLEFKNYFEIFRIYEALNNKLSTGDLIQKIKPNTFVFRLWSRVKALSRFIKPILAVALVILIAGYLIYTMMHKTVDEATVINFEQIGTVEIEGAKILKPTE